MLAPAQGKLSFLLVVMLQALAQSDESSCTDAQDSALRLLQRRALKTSSDPAMTISQLSESLEGDVRAVSSNWNGWDAGLNTTDAASYYFCYLPGMYKTDRPSYWVTVKSVADIQNALKFAVENNMTVSVKSLGHSYMGAGYGGKLTIYMGEMRSVNMQRGRTYCGTEHDSVEVGGGTRFMDVYNTILDNFTVVGGACPTVNAGGGWILGNGMSNEILPKYGIGIDQVLQYDVVLADGRHVHANKCSHPKLFKALRGGGGGFGVVAAVHYKLHPPTPMQWYGWTSCRGKCNDISDPNTVKRWDLLLRWVGKWDRRWSTKHISTAAIYTFLGTHEEAQASAFYQDATSVFGVPNHTSWRSVLHFKLNDGGSGPKGDYSWMEAQTRTTDPHFQGNWLIPLDYLVAKPVEARNVFINMSARGELCPFHGEYFLVGKNNDITEAEDPTSVLPATRRAAFQFTVCNKSAMDTLMTMFPDSGQGINHAPANLQDWQRKLWGSHYPSLLSMKKKVDPHGVFQCHQCVGNELRPWAKMNEEATLPKVKSSVWTAPGSPHASELADSTDYMADRFRHLRLPAL
eukprot:TRINITY_DN95662_c0_g1_i1.p1 TRINITY_DN95662_c0_g1~~TRINITY_DN95662_c0_g1_i1.p1  ORF type:complete len:574 (+),score=67.17 TRINITY_DN95662_c0_g1_i1:74-1795(+)